MKGLRMLVAVVLFFYERWRGPKTVREVKLPNHCLGSLKGITVRGYEIEIFCQRKEFIVQYDRWFIPNRRRRVYHVFSRVSRDAPESLQQVCLLEMNFPEFIHQGNFDHEIRRTHVLAYLDALQKRTRIVA